MSVADDMFWIEIGGRAYSWEEAQEMTRRVSDHGSELPKLSALTSWLGGDFAELWSVTVGSEWLAVGECWVNPLVVRVANVCDKRARVQWPAGEERCLDEHWRPTYWQVPGFELWPLSLGSFDEAMARGNVESIDEPIPYTINAFTPSDGWKVLKARQPFRAEEMVAIDYTSVPGPPSFDVEAHPSKTRDEQLTEYMTLMPEGFSRSGWRRVGVAIMSGEVDGLRYADFSHSAHVLALEAIEEATPDTWHAVLANLYRTAPPDPSEPDATPWGAYDV